MKGQEAVDAIDRDIAAVREIGGTGTPTVLINGMMVFGAARDSTSLEAMIREAIRD